MNMHMVACVNLMWHAKHSALGKQAFASSWCQLVPAAASQDGPWPCARKLAHFITFNTWMSAGTQAQFYQIGCLVEHPQCLGTPHPLAEEGRSLARICLDPSACRGLALPTQQW